MVYHDAKCRGQSINLLRVRDRLLSRVFNCVSTNYEVFNWLSNNYKEFFLKTEFLTFTVTGHPAESSKSRKFTFFPLNNGDIPQAAFSTALFASDEL